MVIGRGIGQVHPLHVHDAVPGLQFQQLAGDEKSLPLAVRPLIAKLAAGFGLVDTDGHGPAVGAKQPSLNQGRLSMCPVYGFRGRGEVPGNDHMGVAFGLQCHFAHFSSLLISDVWGFGCSWVLSSWVFWFWAVRWFRKSHPIVRSFSPGHAAAGRATCPWRRCRPWPA